MGMEPKEDMKTYHTKNHERLKVPGDNKDEDGTFAVCEGSIPDQSLSRCEWLFTKRETTLERNRQGEARAETGHSVTTHFLPLEDV